MIPILKCRLLRFPELVNRSCCRSPNPLPKPSPNFPSYLLQRLSSPLGDRAQASRPSGWVDSLVGGFILQLYPCRAPPRYNFSFTSSVPTSTPTSPLFVLFSLPSLSAKKKKLHKICLCSYRFPEVGFQISAGFHVGSPDSLLWGRPVHARTFNSISGFHPLDASSTHTPPPPR